MLEKLNTYCWGLITGIVICLINGWASCHRTTDKEIITITDTLVLTDTIIKFQPKPYKVTIIDTIYLPQQPQQDTLKQPQIDTLIRKDTQMLLFMGIGSLPLRLVLALMQNLSTKTSEDVKSHSRIVDYIVRMAFILKIKIY